MNSSNIATLQPRSGFSAIDRFDYGNLTPLEAARLAEENVALERRLRAQIEMAGGDTAALDAIAAEFKELEADAETEAWALRLTAFCMTRKSHGP